MFISWWIHRVTLYLAIINNTTTNQRMQVGLGHSDFWFFCLVGLGLFCLVLFSVFFFLCTHTQEYGLIAVFFDIVKGLTIVFFHSDCTSGHFEHQCARARFSLPACQGYLPFIFAAGILAGVKWWLATVLISSP